MVMQNTLEAIEQLKTASTLVDVKEFLSRLLEIIEYDYFLIGLILPQSITRSDVLILDNYPQSWRQYYDDTKLVKMDPIVRYSMNNYLPIIWAHLEKDKRYSKQELLVIKKAHEAGLQSGFSIPFHNNFGEFGMISFALKSQQSDSVSKFNRALPFVQLIVPALQDALKRIDSRTSISNTTLTKRETECLTWAAEGKSSWEISKILGCSERTVLFHLQNAGSKLNANNRYQTISKAIISGALSLSI
ncbi:LuxR family transcriptional regulator [Pseudoalteromonas sp. S558]|uniref:LuxR family transcriptional regulator n=1 Tax=Pseudoalteromonas sp. S558 TaxID=2066515 RepID=UPI00110BCBD4|nr:LuxR family transcriptional regulator [Pseudoalteromonas sp. S558]TMN94651.1 transcriptional regulator [Pseudoalteromonas sp. S558]